MMKKIFSIPLALILTLFIIKPYFHSGFPYTHDGENHLARFANYKVALREGQFPPRFAPNLMNHYGYPVLNYNYPLANIISLPFSFLKINYELTFKLIVAGFIFFGISGVFHWLDRLKVSYGAMIFGGLLYALNPFIWSMVLFRGNIGEIMAWALFPWLLWLIEKLKSEALNLTDVLIMAAFLLSHNVTVMFGIPLILAYGWLRIGKNKRAWTKIAASLLISIALTLWFWLPAVAEKHLVSIGEVNLVAGFTNHFPTLKQLLLSPLEFGFSFPGSVDGISFSIGLSQVFLILAASMAALKYFFSKKEVKVEKNIVILSAISFLLILFQLKITQPIWQIVPLAAFIQFPWRLSLFLGVFLAGLGAVVWTKFATQTKIFFFIILLAQLLSFLKLKPVDYFHRNNVDYDAFSQSTTTLNENTPKSFTYEGIADWQPVAKIIQGRGRVDGDFWSGSRRKYSLVLDETTIIVEPTIYFSGWETVITDQSNNSWQVEYLNNDKIRGRIGYELEAGRYQVITKFTQNTWARRVGNLLSILTFLWIIFSYFKKRLLPASFFYWSWKASLLLIAMSAPLLISYKPSFPYARELLMSTGLPAWIYSWVNFDGVHYLTIIKNGYFGTSLIQAFFPLFPLIIKLSTSLVSNPILVGLTLNTIFGLLLLKSWRKLAAMDLGGDSIQLASYLLFLFPTALFFNAFYTEALFLWLVISSFLSARNGKWWRAGIIAALASATRIMGIMLVPALLVEFYLQHKKISLKKIIPILFGSAGLVAYMFYLNKTFGDPLYFFHVQSEFGSGRQESIILYPQVVWRYLKILWTARPFDLKYYTYVQEFIFGTVGLAAIIWSWFRVRKSYVVFSALVFILPTLTGTFSSMPRYFLVSFSAFLLLTQLLQHNKLARLSWISLSTLLLIFNTILFIQGYWVA